MIINNLSFIIIAHNEQFALKKCLKSISSLNLVDCEVICIDSGSTDDTQTIALEYVSLIPNMTISHISGEQNAAIARNAGLAACTKPYIFFIDGDVEINPDFIVNGLSIMEHGKSDAVFGTLIDYEYDADYKNVIRTIENRTSIKDEEARYLCGGIFMCKKSVTDAVGRFDENFTKCEDFDYTLRLTQKYKLLAIPKLMGIHHTIPYTDRSRMKNEIKNNMALYYGQVLNKNIKNYKGCYAHIKKAGYLKGLLVIMLFILAIFEHSLAFIATSLFILDMAIGINKKQNVLFRLISHYQIPLLVIYGFMTPIKLKKYFNYSVKKITL